jgi:ribosomal-protein-alanine N-acetyltransferase
MARDWVQEREVPYARMNRDTKCTMSGMTATDTRIMPFAVRPLRAADIAQSVQIERDAFPYLPAPTAFHRELKNRMASYLVAWTPTLTIETERRPVPASGRPARGRGRNLVGTFLDNARHLWNGGPEDNAEAQDLIAGFIGTWYVVDEAHILSVGVRRELRGRGIGELMLFAAIEQATARRATVVTLEVRPSNAVAINLYRKYGFVERGLRKGYYADNREDAIIMTTGPIVLPIYRDLLHELDQERRRRWGAAERVLI